MAEDKIYHSDIHDMPDVGGSNRDHDRRYFIRGIDIKPGDNLIGGNEATRITVDDTAPDSPKTDDIWIDTSRDVAIQTLTSGSGNLQSDYPDVFCFLFDCTGGSIAITLDTPSNNAYRTFFFKRLDAVGANSATVSCGIGAGFTIDGADSVVLAGQYDAVQILAGSANYHILSYLDYSDI